MVLMRDWSAEQREDAIACGLHDVAVVAAHRVDHQLECWIDDRARFFRIEILLQLGRSLDVGEQRRHRLALAVEIFSGGRVGYPNQQFVRLLGRGDRRWLSERRAAVSTKAFSRWVIGTAFRTNTRECCAAITAELLPGRIFSIAIRAAHRLYQQR